MPGWSIFSHAVRMILNNFEDVLKISLLPMLIVIAIGHLVLGSAVYEIDATFQDEEALTQMFTDGGGGEFVFGVAVYGLVYLVCILWIIVNWHRFVLLEEYPTGWVPKIHTGRVLSYIGHSILLGLIAMLVMIPFALVGGILSAISPALGVIPALAGVVFLIFLGYRLSIVLPSVAVDRKIGFKEAWDKTEGSTKTIVGLVLLAVALAIVSQIVIFVFSFLPNILGFVVTAFIQLFVTMVGVSVITSLYGIYVEGRQIEE